MQKPIVVFYLDLLILVKAVDGGQSYRDKDITVGMSLESGLSEGETILVYVGIEETFLIEYRRTLPDGRYLFY